MKSYRISDVRLQIHLKSALGAWIIAARDLQPQFCFRRALVVALTCLDVADLPITAIPVEQAIAASAEHFAIAPKRFVDWCLNRANLTLETRHTVDVLLQEAKTQDCKQADNKLSTLTTLNLISNQIADLKPLSSLTNIDSLYLSNNQIADLKPLSSLINLDTLDLRSNQITDIKPLSSLSNLIGLVLSNNQTANVKPLSSLTKLTKLDLSNNQRLTNKTCPVKPASICKF